MVNVDCEGCHHSPPLMRVTAQLTPVLFDFLKLSNNPQSQFRICCCQEVFSWLGKWPLSMPVLMTGSASHSRMVSIESKVGTAFPRLPDRLLWQPCPLPPKKSQVDSQTPQWGSSGALTAFITFMLVAVARRQLSSMRRACFLFFLVLVRNGGGSGSIVTSSFQVNVPCPWSTKFYLKWFLHLQTIIFWQGWCF